MLTPGLQHPARIQCEEDLFSSKADYFHLGRPNEAARAVDA